MKHLTYLFIDLGCLIVPLLASFYPKFPFYRTWRSFFPAVIIVGIPFLVWDVLFTRNGVWGFNPAYLTGYSLMDLPLEEILFFFCIPYACVFTYFALGCFISREAIKPYNKAFLGFFGLVSLAFVLCGPNKLYTFFTGLFNVLLILFVWVKKKDLSFPALAYLGILPFFLLSNGLLTGSFLDEPIVWYNDQENLGFRVFTIPIEDSMYGFLLIVLNILFYEKFEASAARQQDGKSR